MDFLKQKQIFVGYSELGQCILEHKHIELVQAVTINEAPKLRMTRTVRTPVRSIAVLNTMCNNEQTHSGQIYRTSLDYLIQNEYPNLVPISAIHCIDALVQTGIPLIVLNLGTYSLELQKGLVVGYLDNEENVRLCIVSKGHLCLFDQALYPVESVTWCVYALFLNDIQKIKWFCKVYTRMQPVNLAYSLDGYLWAISALATEELQI